ncbi:hypothetical protein VPH35_029101 [Triticum aestivum]
MTCIPADELWLYCRIRPHFCPVRYQCIFIYICNYFTLFSQFIFGLYGPRTISLDAYTPSVWMAKQHKTRLCLKFSLSAFAYSFPATMFLCQMSFDHTSVISLKQTRIDSAENVPFPHPNKIWGGRD